MSEEQVVMSGPLVKEKIKPLFDFCVVKLDKLANVTATGIVLKVDPAKADNFRVGTVISAGPGKYDFNGKHIPVEVKPGDRILTQQYKGVILDRHKTKHGDHEYWIVQQSEISAVLPEGSETPGKPEDAPKEPSRIIT